MKTGYRNVTAFEWIVGKQELEGSGERAPVLSSRMRVIQPEIGKLNLIKEAGDEGQKVADDCDYCGGDTPSLTMTPRPTRSRPIRTAPPIAGTRAIRRWRQKITFSPRTRRVTWARNNRVNRSNQVLRLLRCMSLRLAHRCISLRSMACPVLEQQPTSVSFGIG